MGAYAEAVRAAFPGGHEPPPLPPGRGWVLLGHAEPDPATVRRLFPGAPRVLVLTPTAARCPADGVAYARLEVGPPPRLSALARELLAEHVHDGVVLLDDLELTSGRVLLELAGLGARRVAWRGEQGWLTATPRGAVLGKPWRRVQRQLLRTPMVAWCRQRVARARAHRALAERNRWSFHGERPWLEHLQQVGVRPAARLPGRPLRVLLSIGQLNSGGAERQLCNLAIGLRQRGHLPRVLTTYPLADEDAHYRDDLLAMGVRPDVVGRHPRPRAVEVLAGLGIHPEVVGSLPGSIRDPVLDLAGELLADPPDVLHCWLDYPNVIGAAAGALVGHPCIVLSTRNVNPRHFPAFYQPWMDTWYRFLTSLPQVHLVANSRPGAEDYARWLDLDVSRFTVVRNGVDLAAMDEPGAAEVAALRREVGAAPGTPLVAGVFRLAAEKQPRLFLEVVARVRARVPGLKVVLVGVGEMRAELEQQIAARSLQETVVLLGQRKDVPAIFRAAQLSLLTSAVEGTPNVVLESQWLGCPPVATAAGGTAEALADGVSGLLCPVGDVEALTRAVTRLLLDAPLRERLARAGRAFVEERFSVQRMVDAHLDFYEGLLGGPAPRAASVAARPQPAGAP